MKRKWNSFHNLRNIYYEFFHFFGAKIQLPSWNFVNFYKTIILVPLFIVNCYKCKTCLMGSRGVIVFLLFCFYDEFILILTIRDFMEKKNGIHRSVHYVLSGFLNSWRWQSEWGSCYKNIWFYASWSEDLLAHPWGKIIPVFLASYWMLSKAWIRQFSLSAVV